MSVARSRFFLSSSLSPSCALSSSSHHHRPPPSPSPSPLSIPQMDFQLVLAATQKGGIGYRNNLPWQHLLSSDLAHFKRLTSSTTTTRASSNSNSDQSKCPLRNALIMGRRTWESLPLSKRPLSSRLNVIVSREQYEALRESNAEHIESGSVLLVKSLDEGLAALSSTSWRERIHQVFLIGGASLINEALHHPKLTCIHMTQVLKDFHCDVHIDAIPTSTFELTDVGAVTTENDIPFQFLRYDRRSQPLPTAHANENEEMQYLDLVKRVIASGAHKSDRTGTGTRSLFGAHMKFSLQHHFPLLTTKRVFWRGVVEELLWMIRGCTDSKALAARGVHIWDDNGSRVFLDKMGFCEREEGDLGPVYGHQWRHFGAHYTDCHADYTGQGIDQLSNIIKTIRNNPNDRRMVMSAWNPLQLSQMALPPCHALAQFYVHNGLLSCQMYQRSCDLGLGVPFNIASYSLLTVLIAHVTDLLPGDFVYTLGDAHVYESHVDALLIQCQRLPRPFPTVRIARSINNIDDFIFDDIQLSGYNPYEGIKMKMAV